MNIYIPTWLLVVICISTAILSYSDIREGVIEIYQDLETLHAPTQIP